MGSIGLNPHNRKCTDYYNPGDEAGLCRDDEEIGVQWPLSDVVLSDKDRTNPTLRALRKNNKLPQ